MASDKEDDCILIDDLNDRSCVEAKSAHVISVADSSDRKEKVTLTTRSSENKVMCDNDAIKNDEYEAAAQQNARACQSTEAGKAKSSGCSQNSSKHCI